MKKGITFIDVLVGIGLFLIIFLGIFSAYQLALYVIGNSKAKIVATYIANEELEKIRNLSYEMVGIQNSFPPGVLSPSDEILRNGVTFRVERRVDFVVDSADGIALPDDECPNDYKRVVIKVISQSKFKTEVTMGGDIMPKNLAQECAQAGGVLSVTVFNATGGVVVSPLIEIKNPQTDQLIKSATPLDGVYYFSLAPGEYKIVVSKSGYSSERTYGAWEIAAPSQPNPIVIEGELVQRSFSIDVLSSFSVDTVSRVGDDIFPVDNVLFNLRGAKIIGNDENEEPVYKYLQSHTSNNEGKIDVDNLEWDNYFFSISPSENLQLVHVESPLGVSVAQPVSLEPQQSSTVRLFLSAENTLLVKVLNVETKEPVFSAAVRLKNNSSGYDVLQYSNQNGQTYFIPLDVGLYDLNIQAAGYEEWNGQVNISGQTNQTINLQQIE